MPFFSLQPQNTIVLLLVFLSMAKTIKAFAKTGETWESQPTIYFSMENSAPGLSNQETCSEIRSALRVWEGIQVSRNHRFRQRYRKI
jgi:hypothetical protein